MRPFVLGLVLYIFYNATSALGCRYTLGIEPLDYEGE